MERQAWEQHCERLHQEVSDLSTLCNGLLRDQQMLVSTVIGRSVPSGPAASPNLGNIPGPSIGKLIHIHSLHVVSCVSCLTGGVACAMTKCTLGNRFYATDGRSHI